MIKIGSLWKVDKQQETSPILTGSMGDARLVIFKNKYKEPGKNQPDFILYVDEKKKPEVNRENVAQQFNQMQSQEPPPPLTPPPEQGTELPF